MPEQQRKERNIAYKIRIGDVLKSKPIMEEGKLLFAELGDKKLSRVNILANCVDKFVSDNKKYATLTVDDASGQIQLRVFGDDVPWLESFSQGDTLQIIGNIREYNNELYILPEIVKKVDPQWLLVRKLEIQEKKKEMPVNEGNVPLRDSILEKIKTAEETGGIDTETLVMELDASPDLINQEIKKMLEEGLLYEPRPGQVRYLG
ncbi:MAG: OB-fold nucleic acid binding domain-containing protein [Candidatus Nanoarchaeia archaeon]